MSRHRLLSLLLPVALAAVVTAGLLGYFHGGLRPEASLRGLANLPSAIEQPGDGEWKFDGAYCGTGMDTHVCREIGEVCTDDRCAGGWHFAPTGAGIDLLAIDHGNRASAVWNFTTVPPGWLNSVTEQRDVDVDGSVLGADDVLVRCQYTAGASDDCSWSAHLRYGQYVVDFRYGAECCGPKDADEFLGTYVVTVDRFMTTLLEGE